MQLHSCTCHIHIHSTFSDGAGTVEEILAAARRAGVDVICLTDHNTLKPLHLGLEGWHDGVLLLVGTETNKTQNHYLSFGHREEIPKNDRHPQQVIDAVRAEGGFGFLAHPFEKGTPLFMKGCSFPWTDWNVTGYTGLEIWNYSSQWRAAITSYLEALYYYYFNRHRPVRFPPSEAISTWDRLCRERSIVGICGSDAHAVRIRVGPFKIPMFPYEFLFRSMNNHLLLRQPLSKNSSQARNQVYTALANGNLFLALDAIKSPRSFRCSALDAAGHIFLPGERLPSNSKNTLRVFNPPGGQGLIRLFRNGEMLYSKRGSALFYQLSKPGVYRVEILWKPRWGPPRPWIFVNPFYVG